MGGNADVFSDSDKRARSCQDTTNSREKAVPLNESTMASITSTVIDPENRVCCSINWDGILIEVSIRSGLFSPN